MRLRTTRYFAQYREQDHIGTFGTLTLTLPSGEEHVVEGFLRPRTDSMQDRCDYHYDRLVAEGKITA